MLLPWYRRLFDGPSEGRRSTDLARAHVATALLVCLESDATGAAVPGMPDRGAVAERAVACAERAGDVRTLVRAVNALAIRTEASGAPHLASALLQHAADCARAGNRPQEACLPLMNICAFNNVRDLDRAEQAAAELAVVLDLFGDAVMTEYFYLNVAMWAWASGAWYRLEECLGELAAPQVLYNGLASANLAALLGRATGRPMSVAAVPVRSGHDTEDGDIDAWRLLLGVHERPGDGLRAVRRYREAAGSSDDFAVVWTAAADAALDAADWPAAAALVAEVETADDARPPLLSAQLLRVRGELAAGRPDGDRSAAEAVLRAGITALDDFGAVFPAARARTVLADLLTGSGRDDEAAQLLADAQVVFDRLAAAPWSARVAALSTGSPVRPGCRSAEPWPPPTSPASCAGPLRRPASTRPGPPPRSPGRTCDDSPPARSCPGRASRARTCTSSGAAGCGSWSPPRTGRS